MAPILSDSNWRNRKHPTSFARMIAVRALGNDNFESVSSGYPPTATSRTYGGHVYAQAAYAASKTVPAGMFIHSCSGNFLLIGDASVSFRYNVKRVRDGGVYCLRTVMVFQDLETTKDSNTPCFIATVAFKRDEDQKHQSSANKQRRDFAHQDAPYDHIVKTYHSVLGEKGFEDHLICPAADGIWSDQMPLKLWKQRGQAFPGAEMRKVDMRKYHQLVQAGGIDGGGGEMHPERWRLLMFYRLLREQDVRENMRAQSNEGVEDESDLNLHACAHLYVSDRNSLFLAQRAFGFESVVGELGSLAHTVIFHGPASSLKMVDDKGNRKVYVQESWTSNSGADRVCHNSRLWDYQDGRIIATTLQDGMMRIQFGEMESVYKRNDLEEGRQSKL